MAKTYGRGGGFDISSSDSMGIKPMRVVDGIPIDDDPVRPIRPIIDPIRDDDVPPQDETEEEKPTPEEEGITDIADGIGFDGAESEGSILDNYSFLGFVALAAIGITLIG